MRKTSRFCRISGRWLFFSVWVGAVLPLAPVQAAIVPAPDDQEAPTVVSNGNGYFVVWADKRTYGLTEYDIYGARVSATGEVLDPSGIAICTDPGRQTSPRVAFDGQQYLVVWEDDRASTAEYLDYQIYGARVAATGTVLDHNGFKITTNRVTRTGPAVGSNGRGFFVAWVDWHRTEGAIADIYGSPVSADGVVANRDGIPLKLAPLWQTDPRVVSANGEYLVTYHDDYAIWGMRVSPSGALLSSAFRITSGAANDGYGVASNGRECLVVWADEVIDYIRPKILGALVRSNSVVEGLNGIPVSVGQFAHRRPKVASDGSSFLVSWEEATDTSEASSDVYAAKVTADGELGAPERIAVSRSAGTQRSVDVAFGGSNFLVAWQDARSAPEQYYPFGAFDIFGTLISGPGTVSDTNGFLVSGVVSNIPPAIAIAYPTNGMVFAEGANILIMSRVHDPDGAAASAGVEFFANDRSIGPGQLSDPGPLHEAIYRLFWTNVAGGNYTLTARVTDEGGASSASTPVTITVVSTNPPVVNVVATDADASESGALTVIFPGRFTFYRTGDLQNSLSAYYQISGSASNGLDYIRVTNQVVFPAGAAETSLNVVPISDTLIEPTETVVLRLLAPVCAQVVPPPPGCYRVGPSNEATVYIADGPFPTNQPPVVNLYMPQNGATFDGPTNIILRAFAQDREDGVLNLKVEFFEGFRSLGVGTFVGSLCPAPYCPYYTLTWSNVPPGVYTLTARATDRSSASNTSAPVRIAVGPLPPRPAVPRLPLEPMSYASFVVSANGTLFGWGDNMWSELGYDSNNSGLTHTPRLVTLPPGVQGWKDITSSAHTLAIGTDDRLYVWGANWDGQLGLGHTNEGTQPMRVALPSGASGWISIAAGGMHSLAVSTEGELYIWGGGKFPLQVQPMRVTRPSGVARWVSVAAGQNHSLALTDAGEIYGWGENEVGQLGNGETPTGFSPLLTRTIRPSAVTRWKRVVAGASYTLALTDDDRLYAWGGNFLGQLGTSTSGNAYLPAPVSVPAGVTGWRAMAAGQAHSLGIAQDGRLFAWGQNDYGQLGVGTTNSVNIPTLVGSPSGVTTWLAVSAGYWHTIGVGDDCRVYGWGWNTSGQLGFPNSLDVVTAPIRVNGLGDVCNPLPNVAPTVTIFFPTNDASFVARENIHLLASVEDPDGPAASAIVEFYAGTTLIGHGQLTDPGPEHVAHFRLVWEDVPAGYYSITAKATDVLGWTGVSAPVNIAVRESLPPPSDRELHVVGVNAGAGTTSTYERGDAAVVVNRPGKRVILFLSAYSPVLWHINVAEGTTLERVILAGYYRQTVEGVGPETEIIPAYFTSGAPYIYIGSSLDSAEFYQSRPRLCAMTGLDISSFHGAYKATYPTPFVIDSVQEDERLRCDYPQPTPSSELPQLNFRMAFYNPYATGNVVTQTYTLGGPVNGDRLLPAMRVVPDNTQRYYYGTEGQQVWKVDSQTGARQEMILPASVPELSWPMGLAVDSLRNRVLVVSLGGEGYLYAYSPETNQWSVVRSMANVDVDGLEYAANTDALYSLSVNWGGGGQVVYRLDAQGHIVGQIPLPLIPISGFGTYRTELVAVGEYLVLLLEPMQPYPSDTYLQEARMYLIDPRSGQTWLTYRRAYVPENKRPRIQLVWPAEGMTFPAGSTVSLRAEAADADGLVDRVEFFANGVTLGLGRRSRDSGTSFQLDWASPEPDSYVVTARATDALGLSTISSGVHFAVRTDAPPLPNPERELHVVGLAGGVASNGVPPSYHAEGHAAVIVNRPGKRVTLVLSSYEPVLWHVTVGAGTAIEQVILGGYYAQQVEGVSSNVVVRAYYYGGGDYLDIGYTMEDSDFYRGVQKLCQMTGLDLASFHGAASPPFPEPIVIDRVQNDARLRCDYPRPVDPSFLPNISFRMAWNNGSSGNIIVQNYTPAGPQNGDRLFQGYQVVPDSAGRYYYGAEQQQVWRVDSQNGGVQQMVVPPELPEVSWPMGAAFDSLRNRVLMVTLVGEGYLYAYSPAQDQWSLVRSMDNRDVDCLVYHAADDSLYAVTHTYYGPPSILRFNAAGVLLSETVLPVLPNRIDYGGFRSELASVGDYLVLLLEPDSIFAWYPDGRPESRMYLIDPRTGQVSLTYRRIFLPDQDHDGVPDDRDQCPNTPFGSIVDANGCPVPVVTIRASDANAAEQGSDPAVFVVTRSPVSERPLGVLYRVSGTASNGVDYTRLSGAVEIPAGAASGEIVVRPIDDTFAEGTETVIVALASPDVIVGLAPPPTPSYQLGEPNTAQAFIRDNDAPITELCPCDNAWRSHAEYVRCVIQNAWQLFRGGVITAEQRRTIIHDAVVSNCGQHGSEPVRLHVLPQTAEECRRDGMQFVLSGDPSGACTIETSTDLIHWTPIEPNPTFVDGREVTCSGLEPARARFYRARINPIP